MQENLSMQRFEKKELVQSVVEVAAKGRLSLGNESATRGWCGMH
jgi:hypothetical protein